MKAVLSQGRKEQIAHREVTRAIRSRVLVPQPCEDCDSEMKTHAHHDDYDKPLGVRWLCPSCHRQLHTHLAYIANGGRDVSVNTRISPHTAKLFDAMVENLGTTRHDLLRAILRDAVGAYEDMARAGIAKKQ